MSLPLIFVSTMLITGSELVTAGVIAAAAAGLGWREARLYPVAGLSAALALGVAVAWLTIHTLYTTLHWTRQMQQQADRLLEEVRGHRAELSRTLKASELANSLLRRTQRELIIARKQAEEARRMKEQFAANISHELRTPLNLIMGFSEVMHLSPEVYGDVPWPPTLRRDIYQVYRSSRHLLELIDDILNLSRFELVGFSLHKEATSLELFLRDTATLAAELFRGHSAGLRVELAPNLPSLELDRTRIRQVLLNLLSNARRFAGEGAVRLLARPEGGEVIISVSDTGPGIPADKLPYIFNEFYQVDLSLHRQHQGAGLGLAISKRFVQAHGGSIWVESQEGAGTTVSFSLPLQSSYDALLPADGPDGTEPQWPETGAPCLLVVDPDPAISALVRRHFSRYEVIGIEAEPQLPGAIISYHPRAVIANVPVGKSFDPGPIAALPVPLIECSLPSQSWLADKLRVVACLTKPVAAAQLMEAIERVGTVRDILIADDDRGFGQLVQRMLQTTGREFHVRRTYDGEEALAAMQARPPDLVLLDLIMPGLDGFQVLEAMQGAAELVDIPVILLTATSFVEDALVQRGSQVLVRHLGGLGPGDILRCLEAVVEVLEPCYDEETTLM